MVRERGRLRVERPFYVSLYNPGHGRGNAMHLHRVRAFKTLEDAGLLDFERYSPEEGYIVVSRAGDQRPVGSREALAYLAGAFDMYQGVRQRLDEVGGEDALEALDSLFLEPLSAALEPFMADLEAAS